MFRNREQAHPDRGVPCSRRSPSLAERKVDALFTQLRVLGLPDWHHAMKPQAVFTAPDHHIAMKQRYALRGVAAGVTAEQEHGRDAERNRHHRPFIPMLVLVLMQ